MAKDASRQTFLRMMGRCPFFASLRAADLQRFLEIGQERRIMRRETVFRQGDRPDGLYLLTRGRMKLLLSGPRGRGIILAFVDPGEAFGHLALMAGTTQTHSAQALMESSVLAWNTDVFHDLLRRYPATTRNALRLTALQIQDCWSRLHAFITEPVARRLARALLQLARAGWHGKAAVVSVLQQDLAELLGSTPPTLSRILGKWEARGLVAAGRERIVILHPKGLVHLAEANDAIGLLGAGHLADRNEATTRMMRTERRDLSSDKKDSAPPAW